jgi:hypothetical protein
MSHDYLDNVLVLNLPLPWWEGVGGRGIRSFICSCSYHPHPDPPPSRGREKEVFLFKGFPETQH